MHYLCHHITSLPLHHYIQLYRNSITMATKIYHAVHEYIMHLSSVI